jgi:hypothetical protein
VAAGEERARELRLYAARLEVLDGHNLWEWELFVCLNDPACESAIGIPTHPACPKRMGMGLFLTGFV